MLLFLKQLGIAILLGLVIASITVIPIVVWLEKAAKRARLEWEEEKRKAENE